MNKEIALTVGDKKYKFLSKAAALKQLNKWIEQALYKNDTVGFSKLEKLYQQVEEM